MPAPFYKTSEELDTKCVEYFEHCDRGETIQVIRKGKAVDTFRKIPYTVPDLAYFLGYCSRGALWDLKQNPVHSDTVARALCKIQGQRVRGALNGEQDSRFAQFDLINNFGYTSSKQQIDIRQEITYSDDELTARLAAIEGKVVAIEQRQDVPVIEGDFAPKLLESLKKS